MFNSSRELDTQTPVGGVRELCFYRMYVGPQLEHVFRLHVTATPNRLGLDQPGRAEQPSDDPAALSHVCVVEEDKHVVTIRTYGSAGRFKTSSNSAVATFHGAKKNCVATRYRCVYCRFAT